MSSVLDGLRAERDACGIGFVADANGVAARRLVDLALGALASMRHRGAVAADGRTSDGAGLLLPLVPALQPVPGCAVGMVFARDPRDRERVEEACTAEGFEIAGWREPLHDPSALGRVARESMPRLDQVVIERPPGLDDSELERRLFRARKRIVRRGGPYVASLSFRTIVFKALCAGEALADFYVELARDDLAVPFAVFHQRFSTNTAPSWERAQPFRMLAHNGEINTIEGNANWMRAREATLDERDLPALEAGGSDSALLDNAVELLVRGGRDVRHALAMLVPPAWQAEPSLSDAERDFFRFHAGLTEPWDGPAGLVFSDGRVVGAAADRNGLRPLRTAICESGLVVCASEAGVVDLSAEGSVTRGRVGPGELLIVAPGQGVESDRQIKQQLAAQRPYGEWLRRGRSSHFVGTPLADPGGDLIRRQALFGYTREELAKIIRPIAASGHEPISSMGDDTAIPPLADPARTFYGFFRQRFAQVTNPPIDPLRERLVMSLSMVLGARAPFDSRDYEVAHGIAVPSFFLYPDALEALKPIRLDATFTREETLEQACDRLRGEAETYVGLGHEVLAVSDRFAGGERAPIPALLAAGVVHHHLVARGLRARTTVVVESGEPREVHHFACLLGYGAEAVCAPLALQTICSLAQNDRIGGDRPSPEEAQERFRTAVENGVLKVMSKLGIAELSGYCGAQLFETIGLAQEVVDAGFVGTPARIAGIGFGEIEGEALGRLADSNAAKAQLANPGYIKFRKGGEAHATTPEVVAALHDLVKREMKAAHELRAAVTREDRAAYERFAELVDGRTPLELRDLLDFKEARAIPIDEVEPAESIVKRFSSGAMSHGSLSAEAHEAIAVAFNALGARSNCGEGGEDPARYRTERRSKIKQIASGRFGVTASYAAFAEELQIKVAQGSKPGEGGQLPGHKVTPEIARLRHTRPGVALISPPPHHDIYSIEDLAQLIFDLRQVAPQADVSVKLVAESGVGMVAAGVAKALADVIHIAGADGGTGASPLSSIKNAGAPWELGLVEAQRELIENGLRGRVRLRVDGGFRTGRDVLLAALLGADEVSFGTALLIAEGCLMVRSCHVDTCPVGIATQRPELRAKFAGRPEMIVAYLLNVAEDVRVRLAALGLASFEEAVGRTDLLVRRDVEEGRSPLLDLSLLLRAPPSGESMRYAYRSVPRATGGELGEALVHTGPQERIPITNRDRTVGAHLSGELVRRAAAGGPTELRHYRFTGSAGQSFGAFLIEGVELELEGEANDYVAKAMSGGRIVIHPPANDAGDAHLVGNTVLYGATGGELFCAGRAGERFAVRNSGARAVIEGIGAHGCEYMTGGTVVVLGPVGPNFGAGMTGGRAVVFDPDEALEVRVNHELVEISVLGEAAEEIRALVEAHHRRTGSQRAAAILASWPAVVGSFRLVQPRADVATVSSSHEGSAAAGDEQSA